MTRRYDFRLYPNAAQLAAIERQAVLLARFWNAALQQREDQWRLLLGREGACRHSLHKELIRCEKRVVIVEQDRRVIPAERKKELTGLSYYDQAREIKHIRASLPEYAAMSSASMELCLSALDLAFKAFWRRLKEGARGDEAGYPRYKSAKLASTIWLRDGGWKMRPAGKHWKFSWKGVPGAVKARGRFPMTPDQLRTMEIVKRPDGWFASVVVKVQARRHAGADRVEVDFDLLDHFASVKTGENGGCPAGEPEIFIVSGARIIPLNQRGSNGSVPDPSSLEGDGRNKLGPIGIVKAPDPADLDEVQSARDRRFRKFSNRWRKETKRIAIAKMREARRRKDALHRWTTAMTGRAAEMTVIAPAVKQNTKSAKGDAAAWGAAVETVAQINRNTLNQAPSMAVQMLKYKAEEAGASFAEVEKTETELAVGRDLPAVRKQERRTRRKLKEAA